MSGRTGGNAVIKLVIELAMDESCIKDAGFAKKVVDAVLSSDEYYNEYLDALEAADKDDLMSTICDCDTDPEELLSCITVLKDEIALNPCPTYECKGTVFDVPYLLDEEKLETLFMDRMIEMGYKDA